MATQEIVRSVPQPVAALLDRSEELTYPEFVQEPEQVLARAEKVARALKTFLDRKQNKVEFNGQRYPQAEDWQFVAAFFGHTARVSSTVEVKDGDIVSGYIAYADVLDSSGRVVSSAEAACMRDEPNWRRKPDFQLRSMAQTRACAKSLRNVFAWVMILAGLAPTPAEEMDGATGSEEGNSLTPRRKSESVAVSDSAHPTINFAQIRELFDIGERKNWSRAQVMAFLAKHGFEQPGEIPATQFAGVRAELEKN